MRQCNLFRIYTRPETMVPMQWKRHLKLDQWFHRNGHIPTSTARKAFQIGLILWAVVPRGSMHANAVSAPASATALSCKRSRLHILAATHSKSGKPNRTLSNEQYFCFSFRITVRLFAIACSSRHALVLAFQECSPHPVMPGLQCK